MMAALISKTPLRAMACLLSAALLAVAPVHAGLFDDDEARKAILELRERVETNRRAAEAAATRNAEELKKAIEESAPLRRSLLDLQGQIDALKLELARVRGQDEQKTRDLAETQRMVRDLTARLNERIAKLE